jgi:hypothetical protein
MLVVRYADLLRQASVSTQCREQTPWVGGCDTWWRWEFLQRLDHCFLTMSNCHYWCVQGADAMGAGP